MRYEEPRPQATISTILFRLKLWLDLRKARRIVQLDPRRLTARERQDIGLPEPYWYESSYPLERNGWR